MRVGCLWAMLLFAACKPSRPLRTERSAVPERNTPPADARRLVRDWYEADGCIFIGRHEMLFVEGTSCASEFNTSARLPMRAICCAPDFMFMLLGSNQYWRFEGTSFLVHARVRHLRLHGNLYAEVSGFSTANTERGRGGPFAARGLSVDSHQRVVVLFADGGPRPVERDVPERCAEDPRVAARGFCATQWIAP